MSNILTYEVIEAGPTIDLRPHLAVPAGKGSVLRAYVKLGGSLWWERDGLFSEYPCTLMSNVIAVYDDYAAMKEGGRITEIPPAAYLLNWEGAHPLEQGDNGLDQRDAGKP